jgi:hypothetical protein
MPRVQAMPETAGLQVITSAMVQKFARTARERIRIDDGIWLASFMHYDLGYFDLEQKTLQPLDNPFGTRLSPMS